MEESLKQHLEYLRELAEELLEQLGIKADCQVEPVEKDGEETSIYQLTISGEDLGILIGYHGETLNSLQHFFALSLWRRFGEWLPIRVDVGGYRQEQEKRLTEIARKLADRALFENQPIHMRPMPAFERKVIHTALGKVDQVETHSEGEGRARHVVVTPA